MDLAERLVAAVDRLDRRTEDMERAVAAMQEAMADLDALNEEAADYLFGGVGIGCFE